MFRRVRQIATVTPGRSCCLRLQACSNVILKLTMASIAVVSCRRPELT